MGLLVPAIGRQLSHGLSYRHDVVSADLLRCKRQEDPHIYHYLCYCTACSQYGHYCSDCCPVRPESILRGSYALWSCFNYTNVVQTNRVQYFHYMWTPLPEDGSVKCQSPSVQTTVGFVQGGAKLNLSDSILNTDRYKDSTLSLITSSLFLQPWNYGSSSCEPSTATLTYPSGPNLAGSVALCDPVVSGRPSLSADH